MCHPCEVKFPERVLSKGSCNGFETLIVNNGRGHRCGYIRIPKGHPWHQVHYDKIELFERVHGELTYSDFDMKCEKEGLDEDWWIGFDCAHLGDATDPDLENSHEYNPFIYRTGVIKTQKYVERQCRLLCQQAKEAVNV